MDFQDLGRHTATPHPESPPCPSNTDCATPNLLTKKALSAALDYLKPGRLRSTPTQAGSEGALCTLGIVVLRNPILRLEQVTYFLCTLHFPECFAKVQPANYACPVRGAGRGPGNRGKVSDAHARCGGRPPPRPLPNTFYINSTHKACSSYCTTPLYSRLGLK